MRRTHSVVFPIAVAGLVLAGWMAAGPLRAQTADQKGNVTQPPAPKQKGASAERAKHSERDEVARRQEWFYRQRRYPLSVIPGGARQQAIQQREASKREMMRSGRWANGAGPGPMAPFNAWTSIGPTPTAASGFDFLDLTFNETDLSGRINAIAVDPASPNIVYLGGADGGLWRSTDSGAHWIPLTDDQPSLAMGAIAIDPGSCGAGYCQTVYVGTGEANFAGDNYYGAGVLKLTMTGAAANPTFAFTQLGANPGSVTLPGYVPPTDIPAPTSFVGPYSVALGGSFFSDIVVNPTNSNKLLASVRIFENADGGASSGIFCSDDAGVNWTLVKGGAPGTAVVISPDGLSAYGALGNPSGDPQNGVYKTSNATAACTSQTWVLTAASLPASTAAGRISLTIAPSVTSGNTVYAAIADPSAGSHELLDVYKTTNGGTTWTHTSAPNICSHQCWYDMVLKVHPNNANVVIFGGSAIFDSANNLDMFLLRTTNGGTTWTDGTTTTEIGFDGNNEIHVDQHAIAFAPPTPGAANYTMFVGNDGGAWSTPIGATGTAPIAWTDVNATLTLSQFYPGISIHPSSQLIAIGGLQDNGSQKYDAGTVPGSIIWKQILGSDGGATYIDPASPNVVYAVTELLPNDAQFIQKSFNNGDLDSTGVPTFSPATNGINSNDAAEFIPQIAGDPTPGNNRVLYYPTCQIYQTRDGGANWTTLGAASICSGAAVYVAIAAAADGNTLYAGDNVGHVHMTTSALAGPNSTWADLSKSPLPAASSTSNPVDGRAITSVAVSLTNPQFALVGYSGFCGFTNSTTTLTDSVGHIFATSNGGASWTDISGGAGGGCANGVTALPNTPVNAIVIDPADATNQTIYVGTDVGVFVTTNGGGAWLELDQSPRTLPDGAVLSLSLHNPSRTLRAGLHGRGVWDYQLPLTAQQQAFSLASITPVFAALGSASPVTLTVNGQGFVAGDTVLFNGIPLLNPNVISPTQITATIPTAMLTAPGTASISMMNAANSVTNSVPFSVELLFSAAAPPPPNDLFANAIAVPAGVTSFTDIENTANATMTATDPNPSQVAGCIATGQNISPPVSNGAANSIWYSYTPATTTLVEADTVGSTAPNNTQIFAQADTIMEVVTGSPGAFTPLLNGCNDDIVPGNQTVSEVKFTATAGTTYYFMVSQFEGVGGITVFNLNATPNPNATPIMISPNTAPAGTSFPVTLTGGPFFTAPLSLSFGTAVFSNVQIVNSSTITATMTIPSNATIGSGGFVQITTNTGIFQGPQFTVTVGAPTLTSISPPQGVQGTNASVTLIGSGLDTSSMIQLGGSGITPIIGSEVNNDTEILATFQIAANAPLGAQTVTVTTAQGTTSSVIFTVFAPPTITSINPTSGVLGTNVPVAIMGTNLFNPTIITVSGGVTTGSSNITGVVNGTSVSASFLIPGSASLGPQSVTVTADGVAVSNPAVTFTVLPPPPTLTSISPTTATLGSTNVAVTLTGTNFAAGPGFNINAPPGVTVVSANVVSGTTINATFNVASNAATGAQTVSVTTAGGTTMTVAFSVGTDFSFCVGVVAGMTCPSTASGSSPRGVALAAALTVIPAQSAPFPANTTFSCLGLPNQSMCNFTSTAPGFSGGAVGTLPAADGTSAMTTVTVSFMTTAPSLVGPRTKRTPWGTPAGRPFVFLAWATLLLVLGALFVAARRGRRALRWGLAAVLILAFAGLTGACGGSSGSGGGGGGGNPGTTPGTYPITVMATSGTASHSVTFTLTVQ